MSPTPALTALNLAAIRSKVVIPADLDPKGELFALLTQANAHIVALGDQIDVRDQKIAARDQMIAARDQKIAGVVEDLAALDTELAALNTQLRGRRPSGWPFVLTFAAAVILGSLACWLGYWDLKVRGELAELRKQGINAFPQQLEAAKKEAFQAGADAEAKAAEELAAAEDLADATYCFDDSSPMMDVGDGMFALYCEGNDGDRIRFCRPPADAAELDVKAEYCWSGVFSKTAGDCVTDDTPMSGDLGRGVFGLACRYDQDWVHAMFCTPPANAQEIDTEASYCVAAYSILPG
jgi:hypothetical protein